ncbi:helix-turn-helix domain-containing protein [Streptomyces sp. NPDC058066]|uniref:helix-turn-helix domain-containing protein n=1 Tax=Streptomyces sp. NPDC058066 TaxID=3346323 RepID=UPI0036E3FFB5
MAQVIAFAARLRSLREAARLTLDELADRAHYGKSTLSAAAKGQRLPSWEVTWAFVAGCDPQQSQAVWLQRWREAEHAERARRAQAGLAPLDDEQAAPSVEEFAAALRTQIHAGGHSLASVAKAAGYVRSTVAKDARGQALGAWTRVRDVLQAVGVEPTVIERVWRPRWESARRARLTVPTQSAADIVAEQVAAPTWLRAAQAMVWPQLQIRDPMSGRGQSPLIDVPFTDAGGNLSDSWEVINGPRGGPALSLAGRGDDIAGIYRALASRRLVLLGAAGAGASNLARRLGLELLRGECPEPVVPVLLPLDSWNVTEGEPFAEWFERQLNSALGDLARQLRQHQALLPILDDFHTLPSTHHARALTQINAAFASGGPLVLTGTLEAYAAAVEAEDAVITGSAAVRLLPLDTTALATFLPSSHRNPEQAARAWEPVWCAPHSRPENDLLAVLADPALAAAARHLYSETRADPGELLDTSRLPDPAALLTRLVEHSLTVTYTHPEPTVGKDDPPRTQQQLRALRDVLHDTGLGETLPGVRLSALRPRLADAAIATACLITPLVLLSQLVPITFVELLVAEDTGAQFRDFVLCAGAAVVCVWQMRHTVQPYRLRRRIRRTARHHQHPAARYGRKAALAAGCLVLLAIVLDITPGATYGYSTGASSAMAAAFLAPLVYLASMWLLTEPAPDTAYPTLAALHHADLTARVLVGLACTTALAISGFGFGSLAALAVIAARSARIRYHAVGLGLRLRLRAPGLTPLHILNDACDRGLLRRSGSVYHFPHPAYTTVLTQQPNPPRPYSLFTRHPQTHRLPGQEHTP